MTKKPSPGWTCRTPAAMVCVLCLYIHSPLPAQDVPKAGAPAVELDELRLARQAAEARVVELEAALTAARSELEKLRGRYAELYLQNRESGRRLEQLELQAAHLVLDRQELGAGEAEAEALRALESMREAQVALVAEAQALQVYLASVLDVLGPSEVMRQEISARCAQLVGAAQRTLKPLSTVEIGRASCRERV